MKTLEDLRAPSGLFRASAHTVKTGYDKAWIRDNFYECLAFVILDRWDIVKETYDALLDIFIKHEYKIDHAIKQKPQHKHEYIHARYHPETFDEFWEDWGNKQNDAVGAILYMIGELEVNYQRNVINTEAEKRILQKLVDYLESLEYWHDPDSGIWENEEEVHASSVGACVAGLKSIEKLDYVTVNKDLIKKGEQMLIELLPRESQRKFVDLALLTLIYPYDIVTEKQTRDILENVQYHLVRKHGVVRYKGDFYYNRNYDGHSEEAEWCFGFSWLAIIYTERDNKEMARKYLDLALKTLSPKGDVPELYFSNSDEYNENTPLGWAESMFVIALHKFNEKGFSL
jgi:phosphorylase kinase alpha/beta subunit